MALRKFVSRLLGSWRVRYEAKDSSGRTNRSNIFVIKSGVLQGDSCSALLFCIAMAPISHLFYMDDLKLYADSPENLSKLIEKVEITSTAISMKMNTKKCAQAQFTLSGCLIRTRRNRISVERMATLRQLKEVQRRNS